MSNFNNNCQAQEHFTFCDIRYLRRSLIQEPYLEAVQNCYDKKCILLLSCNERALSWLIRLQQFYRAADIQLLDLVPTVRCTVALSHGNQIHCKRWRGLRYSRGAGSSAYNISRIKRWTWGDLDVCVHCWAYFTNIQNCVLSSSPPSACLAKWNIQHAPCRVGFYKVCSELPGICQ